MSAVPMPKMVYFLNIRKGNAKGLGYGRKGGGLFTRRQAAAERGDWLVSSGRIESYVIYAAEVDWKAET